MIESYTTVGNTQKMCPSSGKTIILKCPKHDVPYTMEASSDPVNEGAWKHIYCVRCREERIEEVKIEV